MSDVPSELCQEILSLVPAQSLLRFRCVCKEWLGIIDDPDFIKLHLHRQNGGDQVLIRNNYGLKLYSVSLESLTFSKTSTKTIWASPVKLFMIRCAVSPLPVLPVASCNGLILISHCEEQRIWVLWNPFTREFRELPLVPSKGKGHQSCGLGYDCVSDDYKVIRIAPLFDGRITIETLVYSLKLNSWRRIMDFPGRVYWCRDGTINPGFFLNGALHWISTNRQREEQIIVLDLGTENYRVLPMPSASHTPYLYDTKKLDVLGGCLFLSCCSMRRLDGWIMKEYCVSNSWTNLFSIGDLAVHKALGQLRPIAYLRSKGLVLFQHDKKFFRFDVEKKTVERVAISGAPDNFTSQVFPASLVRLNSNGVSVAAEGTAKRKRKKVNNRLKLILTRSISKKFTCQG